RKFPSNGWDEIVAGRPHERHAPRCDDGAPRGVNTMCCGEGTAGKPSDDAALRTRHPPGEFDPTRSFGWDTCPGGAMTWTTFEQLEPPRCRRPCRKRRHQTVPLSRFLAQGSRAIALKYSSTIWRNLGGTRDGSPTAGRPPSAPPERRQRSNSASRRDSRASA